MNNENRKFGIGRNRFGHHHKHEKRHEDCECCEPHEAEEVAEEIQEEAENGGAENGKDLQSKVAELQQNVDLLKDAFLRSKAENENLRKRFEKEKQDCMNYAYTKFCKDLLPVLDSLELALKTSNSDGNEKSILAGVSITEKEFLAVFKRNGICKIEAKKGDDFDSSLHHIMCEVPDESLPDGKIVEVYQNGYTIHERLLRPVLVAVSKNEPVDSSKIGEGSAPKEGDNKA